MWSDFYIRFPLFQGKGVLWKATKKEYFHCVPLQQHIKNRVCWAYSSCLVWKTLCLAVEFVGKLGWSFFYHARPLPKIGNRFKIYFRQKVLKFIWVSSPGYKALDNVSSWSSMLHQEAQESPAETSSFSTTTLCRKPHSLAVWPGQAAAYAPKQPNWRAYNPPSAHRGPEDEDSARRIWSVRPTHHNRHVLTGSGHTASSAPGIRTGRQAHCAPACGTVSGCGQHD